MRVLDSSRWVLVGFWFSLVILGGSWWYLLVYGGLWWLMVVVMVGG